MTPGEFARRVRNKARPPLPIFALLNRSKQKFECPICNYFGPFADLDSFAGLRKHAMCPRCGALERHRLQYLTVRDVLAGRNLQELRILHVAPEKCMRQYFACRSSRYETTDLYMEGVDHRADIRQLPFSDGSYDLVYCSHVLEHIREDRKAVAEIQRVLRPGGLAMLPVPVVCEKTIEYPEPNPREAGHVRAPGQDYFELYKDFFSKVQVYRSGSFSEKYQLFVYEDRTVWPTKECPLRRPMRGERHEDFVPVCYS